MRTLVLSIALGILAFIPSAQADEEACASCDGLVLVDGQFSHQKTAPDFQIFGAEAGNDAAYREDVSGTNFTITISGLMPGLYTIQIGEVETHFNGVGQRLFDVTAGNVTLATNFDIFASGGGAGEVCYITGTVNHLDDGTHGPLTISFNAVNDNAKFNTLEIRDTNGAEAVSLNAADLAEPFSTAATKIPTVTGPEIWKDPSQPLDARVHDLISRLSLAEKVQQIRNSAPSIPRMGIPAFDYWSEALHGVARNGTATVFPQAIGIAATWDPPLVQSEGDVISTEARAKFNDYASKHNGDGKRFVGLTFWSPNINIFRDPRWGRGQETYGEDPFLSGSLGVAFIQGVQGNDPHYIKAMACAKHYAVHSGPEPERHGFDADPPERDVYETYLPQFEMAVRQGHVGGVMGAYSGLFGIPDCANHYLLTDLLRNQWGFDGYIVSDCDAVHDIYSGHHFTDSLQAAAAYAVKAGCDICCGGSYNSLLKAVQQGLITEPEIDNALYYAFATRIRLGMFDPPQDVPWSNVGIDQNDTPENEALSLRVAEESMVLLKNNGVLPLNRAKIKRIAVIGENAKSIPMLVGNYYGTPARPVTILDGIQAVAGTNIEVTYADGCPLALKNDGSNKPSADMTAQAIAAAKNADVVVYVGGISAQFEGEEMKRANGFVGFNGGDRTQIELPSVQDDLLKALQATGKPVIFVNCSGSAIAMPWEAAHLPAILQAWYPGEQGGRAVGQVLFGDVDPAGRLPVTFYASTADLPGFEDYSMSNRTYRYFNGKPLYAFGHGLSYTQFKYSRADLNKDVFQPDDTVNVSFTVKDAGKRDGEEVAQVYFRHVDSAVPQPKLALCSFVRIPLMHGTSAAISLQIPTQRFRYWDTMKKQYVVEAGDYELLIGSASDDIRLRVPFKIASD